MSVSLRVGLMLLFNKTWESKVEAWPRRIRNASPLNHPWVLWNDLTSWVTFLVFNTRIHFQHQKGHFTKSFLKLTFCLNLIFIFKSSFVVLLEGFFFFLSWQLPSNSSPCLQSLFWATSRVTYITLFNCYWTGSNNLGKRLRQSRSQQIPALQTLVCDFPSPMPAHTAVRWGAARTG